MDTQVIEVNGELICQKYDHNLPILLVIMEESVPFADKFLCSKCLLNHRYVTKMTPINTAIDMIKEKIIAKNVECEQLKQTSLQALKQFQQDMNNIQTQAMKHFEEIQRMSEQWIFDLEEKQIQLQFDLLTLFKEYEEGSQSDQIDKDQMKKNNNSLFIKIALVFKKLLNFKEYKNCYEDLKKIIAQSQNTSIIGGQQKISKDSKEDPQQIIDIQEHQFKPQFKESQVILIQSIKQNEWSHAMAFNNTVTILVAGCEKDLKVWKFENQSLSEDKRLKGHTGNVRCIVFSKKLNWFASGSADETIRCWKEQNNKEWQSRTGQQHTGDVVCLILNNNENELISCSYDGTIIVWKVNSQQNLIEYYYTLQEIHTDDIICINQNEAETALVSCSDDKQIILWMKDKNNKWIYKHHITNDDYGFRICFIDNDQIIWQQEHKGISHIFEVKNGQLLRKPNLNIELNQSTNDDWLFPTIFNKQKQIIIQKHNKYVYIIQKNQDGKLFIVYDSIDCNDNMNFGTLSIDGEYLVIWNSLTHEFKVYNIKYK